MPNSTADNIQRVSRKYLVLIKLLIVIVPVGTVLYWVYFNSLSEGFVAHLPVQTYTDLPALRRVFALIVSALPMSVALYALLTLKTLFSLYAQGTIFSAQNVMCFRRLGFALTGWVVATMLFTPLISLVLSYRAAGKGTIVAEFGVKDIIMLVISGVVIVVSWTMSEGCKLKNEQALTI